jgi:hypothetical protein
VFAAVIGVVFRFTNGFRSDFQTFYVQHGDNMIFDFVDNYPVSFGEKMRFDVKYTFGFFDKELSGYTVKIVPNVSGGNDFDFTVDGLYYSYGYESDLTSAFDLDLHDDYFTLFLDDTMTVQTVLEKLYEGATVVVPDGMLNEDYFTLIVTSYDDTAAVYIGFGFSYSVTDITLNTGSLVF